MTEPKGNLVDQSLVRRPNPIRRLPVVLVGVGLAVTGYFPADGTVRAQQTASAEAIANVIPALTFEIAVHHIGEEIRFYVSTPEELEETITKQIQALYQEAYVEKIDDYNIFHPRGVAAASYITLSKEAVLPIKDFLQFGSDPLTSLTNSLTKLAKEREEMLRILQIVEQLMQMHIKGLKELGVDLQKQAQSTKSADSGKKASKKPIEDILK